MEKVIDFLKLLKSQGVAYPRLSIYSDGSGEINHKKYRQFTDRIEPGDIKLFSFYNMDELISKIDEYTLTIKNKINE